MNIDKGTILHFLVILIVSCIIGWFTQPMFHGNVSALNTIITIISILSGFSLLVISQLGDISLLPKGKSLIAKTTRDSLKKKFASQRVLYVLYVGALLFAILTSLTKDSTEFVQKLHIVFEYLFIIISVFCLFVSFKLPAIIEEINDFKYDVIIQNEEQKEKEIAEEIKETKNNPN